MIYCIVISIIVAAIAVGIYSKTIKNKRFDITCQMITLYDKMELLIAQNSIPLTNELIGHLKGFKNLVVNNQLADIQVVMSVLLIMPNSKVKEINTRETSLRKKLPSELIEMGDKLDGKIAELVNLSKRKPDFLLFLVKLWIIGLYHKVCAPFRAKSSGAFKSLKDVRMLKVGMTLSGETKILNIGAAMLQAA